MTVANPTWINDTTRRSSLDHLAGHPVDVAVVGGGITGAGVALDAVSRGLSVALVEGGDFASGTSGYSSKLIHGGMRYLASMNFGVAWESAVERRWLMERIAPHLVRRLGFVIPVTRGNPAWEPAAEAFGTVLYDVLRRFSGLGSAVLPRPRLLARRDVAALAPALDMELVRRGILYWDGQVVDDARLVFGVIRTAAGLGAHVLRDVNASALTATAVHAVDTRTGAGVTVNARVVVNATGVWAAGFEPELSMTPSRGTHLVVDAERLGNPQAAHTVPVPGHFGRYVFVLPQPGGLVYIGITDEEDRGADGHHPAVPERDVGFLLDIVNTTLAVPLSRGDVVGSFAGLRPLAEGAHGHGDGGTADISRRHLVLNVPGAPITVVGGKLTTYRRMAQDAVDAASARLGVFAPSRTRTLPLVGAVPAPELAAVDAPARLVEKYGTEAASVQEFQRLDPLLAEPLFSGCDTTGAELLFGILAEGASSVEDLLERRTRLSFVPAEAAKARGRAAEILARAGTFGAAQ
ncbi:glycerol-3-phosphate dehydrogenase/oxidase [Arthrobacter silviterrae]|uniref:Glycerol-3-phosphate dehydrogenase n=1 Tax=Arthrobacter silviterrae TaxID=2026658 RepID=A0ABX0DHP2_9MICC|nr:glycerol-3-phosphate dehydrogenase/oxidase [Arthrobacter silviterrae]